LGTPLPRGSASQIASLCEGLPTLHAAAAWSGDRATTPGRQSLRAVRAQGDPGTELRPRRGLVLILVLVVIAMLSLGAYSFTSLMLAHHEAAIVTGRQAQARSLVDSGVTAAQLF